MKVRKMKTAVRISNSSEKTEADWQVCLGNSEEILKSIPDNAFDSVVSDPPYYLGPESKDSAYITSIIQSWINGNSVKLKGKGYATAQWDQIPSPSLWREVYRVLKPGAHCAIFSSSRTDHLLKLSLILAGFEINDTIAHIWRSGYPKHIDLGRALENRLRAWGHKPPADHQDIEAECTDLTGDAFAASISRRSSQKQIKKTLAVPSHKLSQKWSDYRTNLKTAFEPIIIAKKPHAGGTLDNIICHGVGGLNIGGCRVPLAANENDNANISLSGRYPTNVCGNLGEENRRFFHDFGSTNIISNRASSKDKDRYLSPGSKNDHITPKSIELMQWLVRLVTPKGGKVLDPFTGSGSTGIAALLEGFNFSGIELNAHYHGIATTRITNCARESRDHSC
jgi:site-specific DNA-methyltransferase (adenine-specific)